MNITAQSDGGITNEICEDHPKITNITQVDKCDGPAIVKRIDQCQYSISGFVPHHQYVISVSATCDDEEIISNYTFATTPGESIPNITSTFQLQSKSNNSAVFNASIKTESADTMSLIFQASLVGNRSSTEYQSGTLFKDPEMACQHDPSDIVPVTVTAYPLQPARHYNVTFQTCKDTGSKLDDCQTINGNSLNFTTENIGMILSLLNYRNL